MTSYPAVYLGGLTLLPNYPRQSEVQNALTFQKYNYNERTHEAFCICSVRGKHLLVPRRFPVIGNSKFGPFQDVWKGCAGSPFPQNIKVKRPLSVWSGVDQFVFTQDLMSAALQNRMGGVGLAPCACGKTAIGLELARWMNCSTLVIMARTYQVDQWLDEAGKIYDGYHCGVYQGKRKDMITADRPVVLGMINSLVKEKNPLFFEQFGLVIFDECHHIPADTWVQLFARLRSQYIIGLTASLTRSDGLDIVFRYTIGSVIATAEPSEIKGGVVWQLELPRSNISIDVSNRMTVARSVRGDRVRTKTLAQIITRMYNQERDMFVFGDIKDHLIKIMVQVLALGVPTSDVGCYFSGMTTSEELRTRDTKVTFITYQMASEGFNLPRKDAILCATPPISNLRQLKGRISRVYPGKPTPLVVDIVDPALKTHAQQRAKRWQQEGMEVKRTLWAILQKNQIE